MYITYDLEQRTRSGGHASYPKKARLHFRHCERLASRNVQKEVGAIGLWSSGRVRAGSGRLRPQGVHRTAWEDHIPGLSSAREGGFAANYEDHRGPGPGENVSFYLEAEKLPERYLAALPEVR